LASLKELSEEKFADFAPGYGKIGTALEEVRQVANSILQKKLDAEGRTAAPAVEQVEEGTVEEPVAASSYSGAAAAPARAMARRAVSGIDPADAEEAALRLAAVAKFLRAADGYSPAPYLMLRGFRWGELRGLGETPDPAMLVAPSTETRQQIKRLALDSDWAAMLEAAETAMAEPCGRAWLDLQRYVVTACETFGYPAIAAAIRSELRALLADLPGLPAWSLSDDTPTANNETQAWLKELGGSVAVSYAPAMIREEEPEAPDTFALAMESARKGRHAEALELLAQDVVMQSSGRGRFQRKLQLAQFCMASGHENLALPILEQLVEDVDKHRLEEWESPDAVAQAMVLLYRCLKGDSPEKAKLFARICRLDPVQALGCSR
jgi:type VI secretion system protein ImpA